MVRPAAGTERYLPAGLSLSDYDASKIDAAVKVSIVVELDSTPDS